jgi:hypothetical protein
MTADISRAVFDEWRAPRFGTANPTRLDNPLWAALVHERINAWQVNKRFGYERVPGAAPTWCFDRFGQSETPLDDNRTLYIAGEHEDYYDPDFYIYNDVVVVAPDGTVAIYGYPRDVFPPTDFHTATRDGDAVWLVGSLGYAGERRHGTTQVCRLDLATVAIESIATTGEPPGWIHRHRAELVDGAIVVRGGLVERGPDLPHDENIDEWALDTASRVWTRRTALDWQRWAVRRADGRRNVVWELRQLQWEAEHPDFASSGTMRDMVMRELGQLPDLAPLATLYRCTGATAIEQDDPDEYNIFRIELDGVIVRFTEDSDRIAAMVEGKLSELRLRQLQQHVLQHLAALHGTAWELER